jgi:ABC-type lipoprotein release transport system permease subunit
MSVAARNPPSLRCSVGVCVTPVGASVLGLVLRQGVFQILVELAVGLGLTGLLATVVPAQRATRVDPVEALRDS